CILIQARHVLLDVVHMIAEECFIIPALIDDIFCHGCQPYQIATRRRSDEEIRTVCQFIFEQVGDNDFLPAEFLRTLHTRREYRMGFCSVGTYGNDEFRLCDVTDASGISAISDGAPESHSCRGLAVS